MQDAVDDLIGEALLVFNLAFSIFAFATTEDWSRAILLGLNLALLTRAVATGRLPRFRDCPPILWAAIGLSALAFVQATRPVKADSIATPLILSSFSRPLSFTASLDWLSNSALLLSVPGIVRSDRAFTRMCWAILVLGSILSLVGIAQQGAGNTLYLGIRRVGESRVPFGPFPNKNHAATILMISLSTGAGLLARFISFGESLRRTVRFDELIGRICILLTLMAIILWGLYLAKSRASWLIIGTCIIFASMILPLASKAGTLRKVAYSAALFALLAASFHVIRHRGIESALNIPLSGENSYDFRRAMARDARRVIAASPWFGVGMGSYRVISPLYQEDTIGDFLVDHVHCDPLQLAAEAGVPLAFLYYFLMLLTVGLSVNAGRTPERVGLAFGMLAFLLHQLLDFPAQIPGIVATVMAITAALWGNGRNWGILYPPMPTQASGLSALFFCFWALFSIPRILAAANDMMASRTIPPMTYYYRSAAIRWQPTYERHFRIARDYVDSARANPVVKEVLWANAIRHTSAALEFEPANPNANRLDASLRLALGRSSR